jgi:MFS family permease
VSHLADRPQATLDAVQRRTVSVLVVGQMLAGIGVAAGVSVGALVAADVLGRRDLAGLVQTSVVLGAAVLALPAARVSARLGRGPGLAAGLAAGAAGAGLAVLAATIEVMALLLAGSFLLGGATAAGLQARFAATDLARPDERARALSVVVWATTIGAVLGPNLVGPAAALGRWVGVPGLAGPYLVSALTLAGAAVVMLAGLRPDPLRLAAAGDSTIARQGPSLRRGLAVARSSRGAATAILTAAVAHTVMVMVMVMTPVHMNDGGASITLIGLVISGHIAGMYALSPVMGWAADRFGRLTVSLAGATVLALASAMAAVSAPGPSPVLAIGLVLLGLGWSACLVSASALLADSTTVADRPATQGTSDAAMSLSAAVGGAVAGAMVATVGFATLGWVSVGLAVALAAFVVARLSP